MSTKLIIKVRKTISNLGIVESIIGLLYRKEFLSKNIYQILTTKDVINTSDDYLDLMLLHFALVYQAMLDLMLFAQFQLLTMHQTIPNQH